jgi:hypothetical protein
VKPIVEFYSNVEIFGPKVSDANGMDGIFVLQNIINKEPKALMVCGNDGQRGGLFVMFNVMRP